MKFPKVNKDRGYYMRVFRAERDLSVQAAALLFGIGASQWSLVENNLRNASPVIGDKLAKATGAPIELFIMGAVKQ